MLCATQRAAPCGALCVAPRPPSFSVPRATPVAVTCSVPLYAPRRAPSLAPRRVKGRKSRRAQRSAPRRAPRCVSRRAPCNSPRQMPRYSLCLAPCWWRPRTPMPCSLVRSRCCTAWICRPLAPPHTLSSGACGSCTRLAVWAAAPWLRLLASRIATTAKACSGSACAGRWMPWSGFDAKEVFKKLLQSATAAEDAPIASAQELRCSGCRRCGHACGHRKAEHGPRGCRECGTAHRAPRLAAPCSGSWRSR